MRKTFFVVAMLLMSTLAQATMPNRISIQGRLTDPRDVPVASASYNFEFRVYDDINAGSLVWPIEYQTIPVVSGLFNTFLSPPLNTPFDKPYFLETWVNGNKLMPRVNITSSGYAFYANVAGSYSPNSDLNMNTYDVYNANYVNASRFYGSSFYDSDTPYNYSDPSGSSYLNNLYVSGTAGFVGASFTGQIVSYYAAGAPLVVASTTKVTDLNADRVDDQHGPFGPAGATYIVQANDGTLTNERVLTGGAGISITDGGANNPITVANTGDLSSINEIQNIITNKGLQRDVSNNFGIMNCGTDQQVLKYSTGTAIWACANDNTGTTNPGGLDGQVQYNNGGSAFGGASALYYDDVNNRVGIGTSSPSAKLEVSGSGANLLSLNVSSDLYVNDSYGRVGIGTANPGEKLSVAGNINIGSGNVYKVNGVSGISTTCGDGQYLNGTVSSGGIITGGICKDVPSGGVTSISQGTGILASPNPITGTGTISLDVSGYTDSRYVNTAGDTMSGDLNMGGTNDVYNAQFVNVTNRFFGPSFYDTNDVSKYVDPSGSSYLNNIYVIGAVGITGSVGIGTNSSTAKLDVVGSTANLLSLNVSSDLYVNESYGRVGIGTANPGEKLSVSGNINIGSGYVYKANGVSGITTTTACTASQYLASANVAGGIVTAGTCTALPSGGTPGGNDGQVQYNNGGAFGGAGALYYKAATSRVGIGTSTPQDTLEVVGDVNISGNYIEGSNTGISTSCGNGQYLNGTISSGGIITRGNCVNERGSGAGTGIIDNSTACNGYWCCDVSSITPLAGNYAGNNFSAEMACNQAGYVTGIPINSSAVSPVSTCYYALESKTSPGTGYSWTTNISAAKVMYRIRCLK